MIMGWLIWALAILGILALLGGMRSLWRRHLLGGTLGLLLGLALLALFGLGMALNSNLRTYQRLVAEQPAAQIDFTKLGTDHYLARLRYPDGRLQNFDLHGEEWQLDARILKWRSYALLLGLQTQYRLERLSGRYEDPERQAQASVYRLQPQRGIDIWRLAQQHANWLPWVDAVYGNATFMPMGDGLAYQVNVTTSGLISRPLDKPRGITLRLNARWCR